MRKQNMFKVMAASIFAAAILQSCATQLKVDLAPAVTPDAKELTRVTDDNYQNFYPVLSPDGKRLLYHTVDLDQVGSKRIHIDMKEVGSQGTTPLLTEGCGFPSWMDDNKSFYFTYTIPNKPVIAKSKIDQGGINYVSPNANGEYDHRPFMSKGINKVLFSTIIANDYQLCSMDTNGLNFTILGVGMNPHPHPKDKRFVFTKLVGKNSQIFEYNLETGQQTQLTSGEFDYYYPKYSFDGKWIVFTKSEKKGGQTLNSSNLLSQWSKVYSDELGASKVMTHIFLMDSTGGSVKQLTTGNTVNLTPSFGSDGYIYFSSNAGNTLKKSWQNYDIWKMLPNL